MTTETWTPEMVDQLLELWPQRDLPALQIGNIIGVTKNAVISKARRMGLKPRMSEQQLANRRRPAPPLRGRGGFDPHAYADSVKHGGCRFPEGEDPRRFKFCCAPVVLGKSYCAEHASLLFVKPREMPRVDKGHYR